MSTLDNVSITYESKRVREEENEENVRHHHGRKIKREKAIPWKS